MLQALEQFKAGALGAPDTRERPTGWRFGEFEFDRRSQRLARGSETVHLQPLPTRLLQLFLSRPGELIRREEIIEALWSGQVVEFEVSLNFCVRSLRRALADNASEPRYLETVPRRGYRFIADVTPIAGEPYRPGSSWAYLKLAATAVLALGMSLREPPAPERVDIPPEAKSAYLQGAQILGDPNRTAEDAIPYFEKAIAAHPEYAEAFASLASANYRATNWSSQRLDTIRKQLQTTLRIDQTNARGQAMAGLVALRHDFDLDKAREHFRLALNSDPNHQLSLHFLALVEAALGHLGEAQRISRDYAQRYPDHALSAAHLGFFDQLAGDAASAFTHCSAAAELDPTHRVALQCAADTAAQLGLIEARARHLEALAATYGVASPADLSSPGFFPSLYFAVDATDLEPFERARIACRAQLEIECHTALDRLFKDADPMTALLPVFPAFQAGAPAARIGEWLAAHGNAQVAATKR